MIDIEKLSTEYCSEPYELNAKAVVHMIPDIVAELRAAREIVALANEGTYPDSPALIDALDRYNGLSK